MISPDELSHPLSLESCRYFEPNQPYALLILRLFKSLQAIKERDQEKEDKKVDEKNRLTNLLIFASTFEMKVKETKIIHQNVFEEKLNTLTPRKKKKKGI